MAWAGRIERVVNPRLGVSLYCVQYGYWEFCSARKGICYALYERQKVILRMFWAPKMGAEDGPRSAEFELRV